MNRNIKRIVDILMVIFIIFALATFEGSLTIHIMTKTAFDCCRDIKVLSKEKEWLKEVDSCALRCAVFDLGHSCEAMRVNLLTFVLLK